MPYLNSLNSLMGFMLVLLNLVSGVHAGNFHWQTFLEDWLVLEKCYWLDLSILLLFLEMLSWHVNFLCSEFLMYKAT